MPPANGWPVCSVAETASPHRMGAALSYARRYALFTLVGIAGEDDLDAPDLLPVPATAGAEDTSKSTQEARKPSKVSIHKQPLLTPEPSAALRDQLIAEIH